MNNAGNTPLHVAATWAQVESAKTLLGRGADRNLINSARQTAAQIAVKARAFEVARLISTHTEVPVQQHVEQPRKYVVWCSCAYAWCSWRPRVLIEITLNYAHRYIKRTQVGSLNASTRRTQPRGGRDIEMAKAAQSPGNQPAPPVPVAQSARPPHPANVVKNGGSSASKNASPQVTLKRREISIQKGTGGYGFRLEGAAGSAETQSAAGQVVSSCEPAGPGYSAGLRVGDRIMTVNDIDVLYVVSSLLHSNTSHLTCPVSRAASILPWSTEKY
jgi:hypothetical protein